MEDRTRVNFHCHSVYSDGDLTPEALADNLHAAGVRYAALTDHDSVEGLPRFQEALKRRGTETQSIAESLRRAGTRHGAGHTDQPGPNAAPDGQLDIRAATALIHRAGGRAFLAHLLMLEPDLAALDALLAGLKLQGLDGIEAFYEPYAGEQRSQLSALALRHGLLVCAGTDVHAGGRAEKPVYGIDMPVPAWKQFRDAIFSAPAFVETSAGAQGATTLAASHGHSARLPGVFRRRYFVLRIFLPTLLAIALFVAAIGD